MSLDLFRVSGGIQIDESTQILEGAAAPAVDAPVGSVYTETTTGGLYTKVTAGAGTDKWELVAVKSYVDSEITAVENMVAALGAAFNYIGVLTGGADEANAFDLGTLAGGAKDTGDYYKVTTAGWFTYNNVATYFNVGDGLVFNAAGGYDKIDNTNSEVQGTADYVTVTGSTDSGFVVDVATTFKDRVSTAESNITTLQGDVGTLQTDLTALTGRVTTAEGEIDTLQTDVTAAQSDITDIRSFIGAADGDTAPTYTSALVVTQGATLEAAVGELDAAVDTVQTDLNTLEAAVELDSKLTTGTATSVADTVAAVAAKWIVHVDDGAGNIAAYELFAASNGTTVDFTRFALLRIGTAIDGLDVTATQSGANIVLTVSATNAVNVKIKRVAVI